MWRQFHRWPGVVLGILLSFLALTGAILALDPVMARFDRYVVSLGDMTVGDVLRLTDKKNPNFVIDRVRIDYSGRVLLRGADAGGSREVPIDLKTGRLARVERENAFMTLVNDLHRNLALGPQGRPITLGGVLAMLGMLVSGLFLIARRLGGWGQVFARLRGRGADKWHSWLGRLVVVPLLVTVLSGTWMALVTNGAIPSGVDHGPTLPETRIEAEPVAAVDLAVFDQYRLADLTQLAFPIEADWFDVYVLRQGGAYTFLDRQTGEILGTQDVTIWVRLLDLFTLLHTGKGAAPWAAVAGLVTLSVPFFAVTGTIVWWRRRHPAPRGMVRPGLADVAVLVGSETGTTWGFAAHLAGRLRDAGLRVHLGPMNTSPALRDDAILLLLAATYGDGAPPAGGNQFLTRLPAITGGKRFAVLGFGDKSFAEYCAFANECADALAASGRSALLAFSDVNRRSSQAFATWGRDLGTALDIDLVLDYVPPRPKTRALVLEERENFTPVAGAPAAILRFRMAPSRLSRLPKFAAGDLLGILPPADPVARLYSLASSRREGFVELCVARVEGGICSTFLLGLQPGQTIDAYVQPNPDFRPAWRKPTVMIGAGTGIAPFAGMIRGNSAKRRCDMDLFFGTRHPEQDFYYGPAINDWRKDGRLDEFYPAFSRHEGRTYVQDRLREAAESVALRLRAGGTIMVCGSARMAEAVAHEIEIIARPLGFSVAELKQGGRYLEDIY